jgi:hypothetical protein
MNPTEFELFQRTGQLLPGYKVRVLYPDNVVRVAEGQ